MAKLTYTAEASASVHERPHADHIDDTAGLAGGAADGRSTLCDHRAIVGGRLKGLAMRLATPDGEDETFEVALIDERDEAVLVLGRFLEEEIVAVWRKLGQSSGLPLMLQDPDGGLTAPYPQIGPLQLGAIHIRRRHGVLKGRRPRFLTRRKTGRLASRPLVFREREIVAGARA